MDALTIIFGIVGILGTAFATYSIWDSHKIKKVNAWIYEVAKMNVDKNATQSELEELNVKRQEMVDALKFIQEQVPIEAQKAVLFDRYKVQEEQLVTAYNSYEDTRIKLEKLTTSTTTIPDVILDEIKQEIMPEYVVKQRRNKHLIWLTVISFSTSFLVSLPFIGHLGRLLGLLSIFPLIKLFIINIPANRQERKKYISNLVLYSITILLGITNIILALLYYDAYIMRRGTDIIIFTLLITAPLFLIFSIILIARYIIAKRRHNCS